MRIARTIFIMALLSISLVACNATTPSGPQGSHPSTPAPTSSGGVQQPTPKATPTPATPLRYSEQIVLRGTARPDDLAFDAQGHLLFSDEHNNMIGRVNADHTFTTIHEGIAGPEGLVVLADGTLIVAEQKTQRILAFKPGSSTPTILQTLPGTPSTAACKDGVDGIAFDQATQTFIIPDSPTGDVYRMSLDGKTLTLLASGIKRPVGATVDGQGNIYVADECGGAVWRITRNGQQSAIGGFGMPDDVAFDSQGNLLVIDLAPAIHTLIRVDLATGQRTILGSKGYIEPQGLIVDHNGHIFVSDDYANSIVEYVPIS